MITTNSIVLSSWTLMVSGPQTNAIIAAKTSKFEYAIAESLPEESLMGIQVFKGPGLTFSLGSGENLYARCNSGNNPVAINSVPPQPESNFRHGMNSVCFNPQTNRFVAVGTGVTDNVQYSDDGNYWEVITIPDGNWQDVCYSWGKDLFVAVGYNATDNVAYSQDGENWTTNTIINEGLKSVVYSNSLEKFLAVGTDEINNVAHSTDGINWTETTGAYDTQGVCYSEFGGRFVSVNTQATNNIQYSDDEGSSWTGITITGLTLKAICYSETLDIYIAVGDSSVGSIIYSSDGENWTQVTSSVADLKAVTYSLLMNEIVAVGNDSVHISSDGINWNNIHETGYDLNSVVSADNVNIVLATGIGETNNIINIADQE